MASFLFRTMTRAGFSNNGSIQLMNSSSVTNGLNSKFSLLSLNKLAKRTLSTDNTSKTDASNSKSNNEEDSNLFNASSTSRSYANIEQEEQQASLSAPNDDDSNKQQNVNKEDLKKIKKKQEEEAIANHPFKLVKAVKVFKSQDWFPTLETHAAYTVDGIPYNKLHIVSIKASNNNTIMTLADHAGAVLYTTTGGTVGFKNSKKSTAVAGQAAGLALSDYAKRRGIINVRVMVKGFGNGRMASIKALQMGKLNIVSITDRTPIPIPYRVPPRPPARRRL